MVPKTLLLAVALTAVALAGCTSGNDNSGDGTSTSTSGGGGVGGCVSGPNGGACANATVSGSGSASATSTSANSTTNTTTGAPNTASVILKGQKFVNDTVTIRVGGTVTWSHDDGTAQHTVTADDDSFDSHPSCNAPVLPISDCMNQGETFSQTFATAGDYAYHCKVHSGMTGVVHVVA